MNTEFPSRIPTVRNTTNTVKLNSSTTNSEFAKQAEDILQKTLNILRKFSNEVKNIFTLEKKEKTSEASVDKSTATAAEFSVKNYSLLNETVGILKNLVSTVESLFTRSNKKDLQEKKNTENEKEDKRSIRKFFTNLFNKIDKTWKTGMSSLERTTDNMASTIGSTVGAVFGSGMFGRMLTNIITKTLSFAVSKILVGMVLSNMHWILLIGGIATGIGFLTYYAKDIWSWVKKISGDIWEGLKWIGNAIDQAVDSIISILPWSSSKYEENRKDMAKELGITEQDILDHYGDSVSGRNQAYEDWKRAQSDPEFMKELRKMLKTESIDFGRHQSVTDESLQYQSSTDRAVSAIKAMMEENIVNRENMSLIPYDVEHSDLVGGLNYHVPIINNTNNSSSYNMSSFGNNVNSAAPYSPLRNYNSDSFEGGMSPISY